MNEELTVPDLVVLAFLWDRPMHGYELNKTLEYCEVRDWAAVSRPQVYYSLKKLQRMRLLREMEPGGSSGGPGRQVLGITAQGRVALRSGLAGADWILERPPPPFLTWLALAPRAAPAAARKQVGRRREFLIAEIAREKATLTGMKKAVGPGSVVGRLMVELTIEQFETELRWLGRVKRAMDREAATGRNR